jgi:hypothetical protein
MSVDWPERPDPSIPQDPGIPGLKPSEEQEPVPGGGSPGGGEGAGGEPPMPDEDREGQRVL